MRTGAGNEAAERYGCSLGLEKQVYIGSEAVLTQYYIKHGEILLFDEADRIKWRRLQEKSNKMSVF